LCSGDAIQIFLDFLLAAHFLPIFCGTLCSYSNNAVSWALWPEVNKVI
jgi:hypothetical protein